MADDVHMRAAPTPMPAVVDTVHVLALLTRVRAARIAAVAAAELGRRSTALSALSES